MDLDEVADELYGVPPDEFVAVRRERQQQARADGDRGLAAAIGALPKPTAAAWTVNLLVRAGRAEIESLVELGGLLRDAQQDLAGEELRALNTQRSRLLSMLARQAAALAREHGRPVSSSVAAQVQDTLRAAMADPEAGQAVLSGRLAGALSYSGLGTGPRPQLRVVTPPPAGQPDRHRRSPAQRRDAAERRGTAEERRHRAEQAARRAAEERRRRELADAEQALAEAELAAEEAQASAEAEQARWAELDSRHASLQTRVEELMDALVRAREECTAVAAQLSRADRRHRAASRRAAEATTAREQARSRLADLRDLTP